MSHGSHRVGDVEVVALCDGVAVSSNTLDDSFPGVSANDWARYRSYFPDVFTSGGDRWRFHVHAFLVRTADALVLVDTGAGPADAPFEAWAPECGRLPDELAAIAVGPADVDLVVLTHVHDDHFGGFATADGTPAFPNARYLMHAADWDAINQDAEDEDHVRHHFEPLRAAGRLGFVGDGERLPGGLEVLSTPGHTPGHISVLVASGEDRAVIAGDVLNHPGQVQDRFPSGSDYDPRLAAETRERFLSRVEREGLVLSTAHLTEPFGNVVLEDGFRVWRPLGI